MKKKPIILLLLFLLTACSSSIQEKPTLFPSTEVDKTYALTPFETFEQTSIGSATPTDLSTVTQATGGALATPVPTGNQIPDETITPYPIPNGLLTRQELQQRINDWINGSIELLDTNRMLDEKTGKELKLGVLVKQPVDMVIFVFYSLGFTIIEDSEGTPYLINVVGFEDAKGVRFTSVFHNGRLLDQDVTIRLLQWQGRRINYGEKISSEFLSPERFAEITINLPLSVYLGVTYTDGSTGHDDWNSYLLVSKDATKTLTSFLLCNECFVEDMPSLLEPITNTIPTEYNSDIPYLPIYTVSYW